MTQLGQGGTRGPAGRCADCRKASRVAWRKSDRGRESQAEHRRRWRLSQYGLSPEQYDAMLKAQNGGCAICGEACSSGRRLAIDHDHRTGVVRGLLCVGCNRQLGTFESFREQATAYLADYAAGHPVLPEPVSIPPRAKVR